MNDESIPLARPVNPEEPLGFDTPCVHCGYNLRGLRPRGLCPECGREIVDSTRGSLLRHADPEWLMTLRKGAALKLWQILLTILLFIGAGILASVTGSVLFGFVAELIATGLGLWATFLITTQEPSVALSEDPMALRRVIRACAVATLAGTVIEGAYQPNAALSGVSLPLLWVLSVLVIVLQLGGIVVYFGELVYLRRFARRIPNEKLIKSTTIMMWLFPIGFGLLSLTGVIAAFGGGTLGGAVTPTFQAPQSFGIVDGLMVFTGCFGGLVLLVGGIWYIDLLMKYRTEFARAAALARAGVDS